MEIQLKQLSHQTDCIKAICKVFDDVKITTNNPIYQNPLIDLNDENIIEKHIELLSDPNMKELYRLISRNIHKESSNE